MPVNVECLAGDHDLQTKVTLETFEELTAPLIARVWAPVEQALKEAGVSAAKLASVEVVGGGTRVPSGGAHARRPALRRSS